MNTKKKDFTKKLHIEVSEEQYNKLEEHCLYYKKTKAEVVRKLIENLDVTTTIMHITDWVDPSCTKEIPSEKVDVYLERMEHENAAELKLKEQQLREEEIIKNICSKGKQAVEGIGMNYEIYCIKYLTDGDI